MQNFIEEYLKLTENCESPTSYLKWGARMAIAGVLRDNVFLQNPDGWSKMYPNMYVLLIGESSNIRKSNPFLITERLLRAVNNTKLVTGSGSMQGILTLLGDGSDLSKPGGSGFMMAKELDAFFVKDQSTLGHLTNLYDYHAHYDKYLAAGESFTPIKNVCLSLFGGTNREMMEALIDKTAKEGGFIGRCIVIEEHSRRKKVSGYEEDYIQILEKDWEESVRFLKKLSTIKGEIILSKDAAKLYDSWYKSLPEDFEGIKTKTGYEGRVHNHVRKLAIVDAASEPGFNRIIEAKYIENAIDELGTLLHEYKKLTLTDAGSQSGAHVTFIVQELFKQKAKEYSLTRKDLLHKGFGRYNVTEFDEAMKYLENSDFVKHQSTNGVASQSVYKLTSNFLDKYRNAPIASQNHKQPESKPQTKSAKGN